MKDTIDLTKLSSHETKMSLNPILKWRIVRILFGASEHEFKSKAFHESCNNKGPTSTVTVEVLVAHHGYDSPDLYHNFHEPLKGPDPGGEWSTECRLPDTGREEEINERLTK